MIEDGEREMYKAGTLHGAKAGRGTRARRLGQLWDRTSRTNWAPTVVGA